MSNSREHFTTLGLHLNTQGKNYMIHKWLSLFTLFTTKSSEISATPLPWVEQRDQSQEEQNQREDPAPNGRINVMEKKQFKQQQSLQNN